MFSLFITGTYIHYNSIQFNRYVCSKLLSTPRSVRGFQTIFNKILYYFYLT